MHDNPEPTEEEQELAQTERLEEEEQQRGGQAPRDTGDQDESEE